MCVNIKKGHSARPCDAKWPNYPVSMRHPSSKEVVCQGVKMGGKSVLAYTLAFKKEWLFSEGKKSPSFWGRKAGLKRPGDGRRDAPPIGLPAGRTPAEKPARMAAGGMEADNTPKQAWMPTPPHTEQRNDLPLCTGAKRKQNLPPQKSKMRGAKRSGARGEERPLGRAQ